jgi:hypothetical protein
LNELEGWKSFIQVLIQLPVSEVYLERGREIKAILEDLSKYPYDPINKFRNLRNNEDLPRDELRGAVQRYIYGNFLDSILYSCFSVEFALLVKLDKILSEKEKKSVPKPFTLGRIINWVSPPNKNNPNGKSIIKGKTISAAKRILKLRNMHIHSSNFISGAILGYKSVIESAQKTGINPDTIEKGFELLKMLPETVQLFLTRYKPSDVTEAFRNIQLLSSFEWCSDSNLLKSTKREVKAIVENTALSILQGNYEKLAVYFQEDYLLKKRALTALKNASSILRDVQIL